MTIPPPTSDSATPEVQQAILFRKQIKQEAAQQSQLIETANLESNRAPSESVGQNLNVRA